MLFRSLSDWLRDLQAEQARQEEHGHLSLSEIQRCAGGASLFETLFVYENYPVDAQSGRIASDIEITDIKGHDATHYALTLAVMPGASTRLRFTFDRSRLDQETVGDLSDRYARLVEELAQAAPEARVGEIRDLSPQEREEVLYAFNATQQAIPVTTLADLFAAQVERSPEAVAVIFGDAEVSYRDLDERAKIGRAHV